MRNSDAERKNQRISNSVRNKLFDLVFSKNQSILVAAESLRIKYHTAKTMIARHRADVRNKQKK